ncbi:MAG: prolipoprotein diacylglyceryl transferase family protein, partial [Dehalococcoidia bacterium]
DRLIAGDIFLLYLIWYPATRFSLEFLRADRWEMGGMPMAQVVSLALIISAIGMLIWRHRPSNNAPPSRAERRRRARVRAR